MTSQLFITFTGLVLDWIALMYLIHLRILLHMDQVSQKKTVVMCYPVRVHVSRTRETDPCHTYVTQEMAIPA